MPGRRGRDHALHARLLQRPVQDGARPLRGVALALGLALDAVADLHGAGRVGPAVQHHAADDDALLLLARHHQPRAPQERLWIVPQPVERRAEGALDERALGQAPGKRAPDRASASARSPRMTASSRDSETGVSARRSVVRVLIANLRRDQIMRRGSPEVEMAKGRLPEEEVGPRPPGLAVSAARRDQKSWPWPAWAPAAAFSSFGRSAIIASVVEHQAGDAGRVLQRGAHDLGRVDDARLDQVAVLVRRRVEAERALAVAHLLHDDRALDAGVRRDLAERLLDRAAHDVDAEPLLVVDA